MENILEAHADSRADDSSNTVVNESSHAADAAVSVMPPHDSKQAQSVLDFQADSKAELNLPQPSVHQPAPGDLPAEAAESLESKASSPFASAQPVLSEAAAEKARQLMSGDAAAGLQKSESSASGE